MEQGGFLVHVPALPEVVTGGDTEEEALAMAKKAIEVVLESRRERGEEIPTPRRGIHAEITGNEAAVRTLTIVAEQR